jgi:hypothetical protein
MNIKIIEVSTQKELKQFTSFTNKLYRNEKNYIPVLENKELETLNPKKNAASEYCQSKLWLAMRNNEVLGRIAGIINTKYNKKTNTNYARFGWFDFINDQDVAHALLATAENWARENKMDVMHGPLGFTSFDASGVLVDGFEEMPTSFGHYNYSYYMDILEKEGYEKEVDWIEFRIKVPAQIPEKIIKFSEYIKQRYQVHEIELKSKKQMLDYVDDFFAILNKSYAHLFAFNELSVKQKEQIKKEFFGILQTEYVCFIEDNNNQLVAFGISTPSLAKALKKANGRIFPFGFYHLIKALKQNDTAELLLVGVDNKYKNKGLTAIIFNKIMHTFIQKGIKNVETTRELEENSSVQQLWSKYDFRQHKRARCYIKKLDTY